MRALGRLVPLIALLALVAVPSATSRTSNEPQYTSAPTIAQNGSELVLGNGGWYSYSGPVDRYVYRFTRDGVLVKGADSVPKSEPYGSPPLLGEWPTDPTANVYELTAADAGHTFCGDVYGGTHSEYVLADGTVVYDVIEWGHTSSSTGAQEPYVCLTAAAISPPPPPPPAANPSAALAVFENVTLPNRRAASLYARWAAANPRELATLLAYDSAILARQVAAVPALVTRSGREFVGEDEQAAYDAAIHP